MSSKRPHHDHEELRPKTSQEVRSQRLSDLSEAYEITVKIKGENIQLLNISETGLGFLSNKELAVNADLGNAEILVNGELFFESRVHVKRMSKTDKGFEIGCAFTDGAMPEDAVISLNIVGDMFTEYLQDLNEFNELPKDFIQLVANAEMAFASFKQRLDELEERVSINSNESKNSFQSALELVVTKRFVDMVLSVSVTLHEQAKSMSPEIRKSCRKYFRGKLGKYLMDAPFLKRAFVKPLGYAGDYEMMNQIYRNQFEGATWFGKLLHKYAINEASSTSVRFRKEFFKGQFIDLVKSKGQVTIGALASGPARELVEFVRDADVEILEKIQFVLMDQDIEALLNSKRNVLREMNRRKLDLNITFNPVSVKCILKHDREYRRIENQRFDLIYSAGLYDYLPDPVAHQLTSELVSLLKPKGELIIGNFTPDNPTITMSDFAADWDLILRDEAAMRKILFNESIDRVTATYDEKNIELLLRLKKK